MGVSNACGRDGSTITLLVLFALIVLDKRLEERLLLAGQWLRHGELCASDRCGGGNWSRPPLATRTRA